MSLQTKDRILDVAEELFADFGFATTSLRDITSTAGVNLASVCAGFASSAVLHSHFSIIVGVNHSGRTLQ